ncbi:hypothetical protein B0T21DRAFT_439937 [Apiosordaria backusii]|uniref:Uncharacterized protein n=1 Tax=Apiosordaria backusii TaxID=314023 RepID=A0AA40BKQ3_9PEZI|nr:hypothetical protein B0T21DRAFT_439937 [Apiosordaria backusii]
MSDSDAPIALRRTPRRAASAKFSISSSSRGEQPAAPPKMSNPAVATTPRRKTTRKRVRFSDPGPILGDAAAQTDDVLSPASTGLTPMISRTRLLGTPKSHPRRRHSSAPVHSTTSASAESEEITFLPLRQVLDGRVKRRIRRNGLSEEMNIIYAERKTKAQQTKAEINRLRQELEEKDDEIMRLQEETVMVDTDRVWELERKVSRLKRQLSQISGATSSPSHSSPAASSSPPQPEWTRAARDPFSQQGYSMDLDMNLPDNDHNNDTDHSIFGESTMAELSCSTPTRKTTTVHTSASFQSSFPTPPSTSPARELLFTIGNPNPPLTPCSAKTLPFSPTPTITTTTSTAVQTSLPDPEITHLQTQLSTLQQEITTFHSQLSTHLSLPVESSTPADLISQLSAVLTQLKDKSHALTTLNDSLSGLGFPSSGSPNPDSLDIISTISTTLRSCRLELEYLSPGELVLPLSGSGAQTLQTMMTKLRELSQRNKECEDAIDQYHEIELSLRQQLNARVDVMDGLRDKLEQEKKEKKELEVQVERLKSAVAKYTRDMTQLETLISHLETQLQTSHSSQQSKIHTLEQDLTAKTHQAQRLQEEVERLERGYKSGLMELNKSHGEQLKGKDALILGLRGEIERVSGELNEMAESVVRLKAEVGRVGEVNDRLAGENLVIAKKYEQEKKRGERIVGELGRVLALATGGVGSMEGEDGEVETEKRPAFLATLVDEICNRWFSTFSTHLKTALSYICTPLQLDSRPQRILAKLVTKPNPFLFGLLAWRPRGAACKGALCTVQLHMFPPPFAIEPLRTRVCPQQPLSEIVHLGLYPLPFATQKLHAPGPPVLSVEVGQHAVKVGSMKAQCSPEGM